MTEISADTKGIP